MSSHVLLRSDCREYLNVTHGHPPLCISLPFLEGTETKVSLLQEKHFALSTPSPEVLLSLKVQLCEKIPLGLILCVIFPSRECPSQAGQIKELGFLKLVKRFVF